MMGTGAGKVRGNHASSKLEAVQSNSRSTTKRSLFLRPIPVVIAFAVILVWDVLFHAHVPVSFIRPHLAIVEFARSRHEPWLAFVGKESTQFNFSRSCADGLRRFADGQPKFAYFQRFSFLLRDTRPNVTTCSAGLCDALRQWADLAREREKRGNCNISDLPIRSLVSRPMLERPRAESAVYNGEQGAIPTVEMDPLKDDPLPEEEVAEQQAAGVGQICTEAWRSGVLRRVASSKFIRRLVAEGSTSMANISAGIDAVCRRCKHVEATLLDGISNATSACGNWPEECWPVPHMPFASLSDFRRRRYLVFAMSEEQLSNARSHIVEAARLARMANRILVLPKVSRSHLSLGRTLPVCEYWDLSRLAAAAEWMSPQFFLLLARATLSNPSVGFMWIESPYLERDVFHYDMVTEFLGQLMPYTGGHVPLQSNTMRVIMPASNDTVAAMLSTWSSRNIVVWFKTTWERVKFNKRTDDAAFTLLPYNPHHHATAARLLALLPRPLIAAHFRSEFIAFRVQDDMQSQGQQANTSMVQQRLEWCVGEAEKLITRVRQALAHPFAAAHPAAALAALAAEAANDLSPGSGKSTSSDSIKSVRSSSSGGSSSNSSGGSSVSLFIAADVPFNASAAPARSDSWESMVAWYRGDQHVLHSSIAALRHLRANVNGTLMIDELMPDVNNLDPGVVAILDKLVSAHADVFLAGSWDCGGWRGYETDILSHRRQFGHSNDTFVRWAEG